MPAQLEQHLCQAEPGQPGDLVPSQIIAPLRSAEATSPVSSDASPGLTGNQKQHEVILAGADSSLSADAAATAADDVATAADDAATAADGATAADDAASAPDEAATAADGPATPADDTAGDEAATAWADQVVLGSGKPDIDEETSACHLLRQAGPAVTAAAATCSLVHEARLDNQPGHGATEQLADISRAANFSKAKPQQIVFSAAQLPGTQPLTTLLPATQAPATHPPAAEPQCNPFPALLQRSAASTQTSVTAPRSVIIDVASTPDLLQPTQLPSSPALAPPSALAQHASIPAADRVIQQLPSAAASSVQTDKLLTSCAEAQDLQRQLLHSVKPIWERSKVPNTAQPSSSGLLASHTHDVLVVPQPHSSPAAPQAAAWQPAPAAGEALQAVSSCTPHSAAQCSASTQLQQPDNLHVQSTPHRQQPALSFLTLQQQQQQQQLPLQLLGPASQKLHSLLLQLERPALHITMQAAHTLDPAPTPHDAPRFPSVLLQDPGLLGRVQSTLQGCAHEASQGPDQAQSQARTVPDTLTSMLPLGAAGTASMPIAGLRPANLPAAACYPTGTHDTNASPLSLLPGPLHAAIASAMGTDTVPAAVAMTHQPASLTPTARRQPAACKAGSVARTESQGKGKGTKRSRDESGSHGQLCLSQPAAIQADASRVKSGRQMPGISSRAGTAARPAGPSATACAAAEAILRQQIDSATQGKSDDRATPSAAASKAPVGSCAAAPFVSMTNRVPEGTSDKAAPSAGSPGVVDNQLRRLAQHTEGLPSTQENACKVDMVQTSQARCNSSDPECLSSVSLLESSDLSESQAIAVRQCSNGDTAPAEQGFVVAQHAAPHHGGAVAYDNALHQTPERTIFLAPALATDICTAERLAKDALLMLSDSGEPICIPCEDGLTEQTSGHGNSQPPGEDSNCAARPPPFIDVEGVDAYEVGKIIDKRYYPAGSQIRVQYLVRWKGYGPEDDTWQSRNSLRHARQAIQDYEDKV